MSANRHTWMQFLYFILNIHLNRLHWWTVRNFAFVSLVTSLLVESGTHHSFSVPHIMFRVGVADITVYDVRLVHFLDSFIHSWQMSSKCWNGLAIHIDSKRAEIFSRPFGGIYRRMWWWIIWNCFVIYRSDANMLQLEIDQLAISLKIVEVTATFLRSDSS